MVNSTIFQIVGYQDSGKTTFVKKLIEQLKSVCINTVTIKHHGHGGKPVFNEEKDSYQHLQAGALASIVEGDGHLLLQTEKSQWTLEEQIRLMSFFQPDVILIEGHKYETYPKAIIIRKEEDLPLIKKLTNVKVVFYWDEQLLASHKGLLEIPTFSINDPIGVKWMIEHLQNNLKCKG